MKSGSHRLWQCATREMLLRKPYSTKKYGRKKEFKWKGEVGKIKKRMENRKGKGKY